MNHKRNLGIKYRKSWSSRYLNIRLWRRVLVRSFFTIFPFLRTHYAYYTKVVDQKEVASKTLVNESRQVGLQGLGVSFSDEQKSYMRTRNEPAIDPIQLDFCVTEHEQVLFLGHTGAVVDLVSKKMIRASVREAAPRNYIKAKRLTLRQGENGVVYVPMMGISKGHKQYFHFLCEYFVELHQFLTRSADPAKRYVVVVRNDLSVVQIAMYEALQKRFDNVDVFKLAPNEVLHCPVAHVPFCYTPSKTALFISKDYCDFVKGLLADYFEVEIKPPTRKVYLSRKDAKLRHIINEDALLSSLQEYGFDVVQTADMSLKEQFELFLETKLLVSTHGAGMANMLFMQEKTDVLELASQNFGGCAFLWLSAVRGGDHAILMGGKEHHHQHFEVDVKAFKAKIEALLQKA